MLTPQLSDFASAQRCWDSYWKPQNFDCVFSGVSDDEVWLGIKFNPDCISLTFRGSTIFMDWLRDMEAQMYDDPTLGGVPFGAMQGLRSLLDTVRPMLATLKTIRCEGHSLGAWRAHLFAALLQLESFKVERCCFGSPRPGGAKLASILQKHEGRSYINRQDIVCDAPPVIEIIDDYVIPEPQIPVDVKFSVELTQPNGGDWIEYPERAQDHHIGLYREALRLCFASSS